jgi:hypothetical protein
VGFGNNLAEVSVMKIIRILVAALVTTVCSLTTQAFPVLVTYDAFEGQKTAALDPFGYIGPLGSVRGTVDGFFEDRIYTLDPTAYLPIGQGYTAEIIPGENQFGAVLNERLLRFYGFAAPQVVSLSDSFIVHAGFLSILNPVMTISPGGGDPISEASLLQMKNWLELSKDFAPIPGLRLDVLRPDVLDEVGVSIRFVTGVPEASTWSMLTLGLLLVSIAVLCKQRNPLSYR